MSSLLPGFEYDIFISYRHNDNRSGWVTEFVKALQEELAATIKDPVSVYFDTNPHDGLLETHNVDKSLEGKLKCLIFIPIISQTYCDPKGFAWQKEFCAFNRQVKEDAYGRDIKLSNGNIASRILPVRIHDLDAEDKATIEKETGGVLRAIDFIYKEAGVNRPLLSNEVNPGKNQNQTSYRNQVNKVANAIKEIISGLRNPAASSVRSTYADVPQQNFTSHRIRNSIILALSLFLLVALTGYYFYPKLVSTEAEEVIDKSLAVLPFVDMSESKDQGWFSDGLTEEILNSLAHVNGLHVISRTSSFAFKDKNLPIQRIADSLGVNYVVEGSIRKSPAGLRITAQLIRARDGFHIWSNTYDRNSKDIFALQQNIAEQIATSLDISLDPGAVQQMQWAGTSNEEAYIAFLKANELFGIGHRDRNFLLPYLKKANPYYLEAMRLDQNFVKPYLFHADYYLHYLLLNNKASYQDTLTDKEAFQMFTLDLGNAVAKSKTEIEKDYYRLYKIMYSDDWSDLRPTIERVLNSPEAVRLFTYQSFGIGTLLIGLGYGNEISRINQELLKNDPLNAQANGDIIDALLFSEKYEEVIQATDKLDPDKGDKEFNFYRIFSLYQLGKVDEAYELISKMDTSSVRFYHSMGALVSAKKGKMREAEMHLKGRNINTDLLQLAVSAVYGRDAANKEAGRLDAKLALDFPLFHGYLLSHKNLPFDLSAAPNFAKRLSQAGADGKAHH